MNEQHLQRYAEILVEHGAGLRPGQPLFIYTEVAHRDLALRVGEAAYDRGSGLVRFWISDPLQQSLMIRRGRLEDIELSRTPETQWYNDILRTRGAIISLRGPEFPALQEELAESHPEQHAIFSRATQGVSRSFHLHGINRSLCPWVVAGAVSPGWARQVFPELQDDDAVDRLSELIFRFTFADQDNALELAAAKDRRLHGRRRELNALDIREIHVTGGGSDLRVGFSDKRRWLGGSKETVDGQTYNANLPSEENFTTPDRGLTEGRFQATMPFRPKNGILVKDLVMIFEQGRVVDLSASEGEDAFRRWISTDDGGAYLGEFALVGLDSSIAQCGRFFEHTLFDENASAHMALGKAYATALVGGESMNRAQLDALGCNDSAIHTDIMFGSAEVTITATKTCRGEVVLIENGQWTERFLNPR